MEEVKKHQGGEEANELFGLRSAKACTNDAEGTATLPSGIENPFRTRPSFVHFTFQPTPVLTVKPLMLREDPELLC